MPVKISEILREIQKFKNEMSIYFLTDKELRKIKRKEYCNNFLDESFNVWDRLSVQGATKRGIEHPSTSKEMIVAETTRESKVIEIKTVQQFNSLIANAEGFIIITDVATGNRIHRPQCKRITKKNFEEKVVRNKCRNGRYYWSNNINLVQDLNAKPCSFCKPLTTR